MQDCRSELKAERIMPEDNSPPAMFSADDIAATSLKCDERRNARRTGISGAVALIFIGLLSGCAANEQPSKTPKNQVVGTWRMASATLESDGILSRPYGDRPSGMLVFTPDMHFVEVLTRSDVPRFKSDVRGGGTDVENRRAMATSIGFFGTYTVDPNGEFAGNTVEGSTFPNWVGQIRTRKNLRIIVKGDRMFESFTRPDGGKLTAEFVRTR